MLCAAWTLLELKHVRVDILYQKYNGTQRSNLDRIGHLILGLPWVITVSFVAWKYAAYSFHWYEGSADAGGMPARYVVKYFICFGFVLVGSAMLIQLISSIRK